MPPFSRARSSKRDLSIQTFSQAQRKGNLKRKHASRSQFSSNSVSSSSYKQTLVAGVPVVRPRLANGRDIKPVATSDERRALRDRARTAARKTAIASRVNKRNLNDYGKVNSTAKLGSRSSNQKNFLGNIDDHLAKGAGKLLDRVDLTQVGETVGSRVADNLTNRFVPGPQLSGSAKLKQTFDDAGSIAGSLPGGNSTLTWLVVGGVVLFALLDD